jgi:hypothetical protein
LQEKWIVFSLRGRETIRDDESIRRFLTSKSWIDRKTSKVKPVAFLPRKMERGTSVHRVLDKSEEALWELGHLIASGTRDGILYGQADVRVAPVRAAGLDLVKDRFPGTHAEIVGWPHGDDPKSAQLLVAERFFAGDDAPRLIVNPS